MGFRLPPKSMTLDQGRIKTKLVLMLLPGKGPIFFSAFKTDQEVQDSWLATALSA